MARWSVLNNRWGRKRKGGGNDTSARRSVGRRVLSDRRGGIWKGGGTTSVRPSAGLERSKGEATGTRMMVRRHVGRSVGLE